MPLLDPGQAPLGAETDTDAELFDQEMAARQALERAGQVTAEIVIDLESKGALYQYIVNSRDRALEAMIALIDANPTETAHIMTLQATIRLFTDACGFVHNTLAAGEEAAQVIQETYGNPGEPSDEFEGQD